MSEFSVFRWKSTGVIDTLPTDYINHPVFGGDLEFYDPEGYEEDKVVSENHNIPVEQRATVTATPKNATGKTNTEAKA